MSGWLGRLWELSGEGTLPQSHLYELNQADNHTLIYLFTADTNPETISDLKSTLLSEFLNLFLHRHKIDWFYCDSRDRKQDLKEASGTVKKLLDSLTQTIQH
ncbi:MAG: hypothetical protein AAGG02_13065 [Cyanobacteria bacterium P01_H01_bin.15]